MVDFTVIDTVLKQVIIEQLESVINNITIAIENIDDVVGDVIQDLL